MEAWSGRGPQHAQHGCMGGTSDKVHRGGMFLCHLQQHSLLIAKSYLPSTAMLRWWGWRGADVSPPSRQLSSGIQLAVLTSAPNLLRKDAYPNTYRFSTLRGHSVQPAVYGPSGPPFNVAPAVRAPGGFPACPEAADSATCLSEPGEAVGGSPGAFGSLGCCLQCGEGVR